MMQTWERSNPRFLFNEPVRLRAIKSEQLLVGQARNLSRSGIFVSVATPPPVGTEIVCLLSGHPEIRGRVAWVHGGEAGRGDEPGVGIQFSDRSHDWWPAVAELAGARDDEPQAVNVWFEGMPSPIRSLGLVTHRGIDLSTTLRFLTIGPTMRLPSTRRT
jgi:hypothetical protein